MKILWVKADRLLPVQNGGNIRSYHTARYLAKRHALTFFSYYDGDKDTGYESELKNQFPDAVGLCTEKPALSSLARALDYARHVAEPIPYAISRFRSQAVEAQLRRWFDERAFEIVICDFLDAAINFPEELSIPTVLFQHNVESEIWRRHASNGSGVAKKMAYRMEFSKMLRYEQEMVQHFDHIIAVSEDDKKLMSQWTDAARISVVPTGVDLGKFSPDLTRTADEPLVMFVGAMDWMPNVDAVEYFCQEIWPTIVQRVPGARFRIVGRNPGARVQRLASKDIEVTGLVPSVVEHLREAAAVVVPLRVGGGTRLKIYEAMAMGRAVVSTSVGAEGLDVRHEEDILLADDAASFSEAVTSLLQDVPRRKKYERAAAESAARFDWPRVGARFEEILGKTVLSSRYSVLSSSLQTAQPGCGLGTGN